MLITRALKSNARLLMALTVTVTASAPICSHADEAASTSRIVKYSKPTTAEAARHVYHKIENAAMLACGQERMDTEVVARVPGPCMHDALSRAIQKVNSPLLAQVYIDKNGKDEASKFGISSDVMTAKN